MKYKEAYDKIIAAYFKDEIKPFEASFCFCGTLSPNEHWMHLDVHSREIEDNYDYSGLEYARMEYALMKNLGAYRVLLSNPHSWGIICRGGDDHYEEKLFRGMCEALEVLKKIHIERGEDVDEMPSISKRQLQE